MSDRKKLIELFKTLLNSWAISPESAADLFISNGVTVQKWIPVSEPPKEHVLVLCRWRRMSEEAFYGFARYQGGGTWYVSNEGMPTVTHWMPLPEPPKECE